MLTNFFGKSNPINFIICGAYLLIGLFASLFLLPSEVIHLQEVLVKAGLWVVLFFSILLLDFVIRKNALTGTNTFGIYIFSGFIVMLPVIFTEAYIIFSNVFLMLALRRMVSLTSEKNIEKKIFDASLYITIAALFHFWSVLFLLPLYWAVIRVASAGFRLLFIPLVGIFTVLILTATFCLLVFDDVSWLLDWVPVFSLDFSVYNQASVLVPSALIATFLVWTLVLRIMRFSSMPRKIQRNYRLLTITTLVSVAILFLSATKTGAETLFLFAPLAIVITNYLERLSDVWFKEILLWLFLLLPLGVLFL
tara:strand:+ start:58624 stop:59547 length:924 start_codon:yes stop_codon:yes gene_type:complete